MNNKQHYLLFLSRYFIQDNVIILYYNHFGHDIQMTSKFITIQNIISNCEINLKSIEYRLRHDGFWPQENNPFKDTLDKASKIIGDMKNIRNKSFNEIEVHNNIFFSLLKWYQQ